MEDSMLDDTGTAVVEPVALSADGGAGSAPAPTPQDGGAGGAVDSPEEGRASNQLPKWAYNIVRENRTFKRDLAELRERLAAQPRQAEPGGNPDQTDVWTDPDKWADAKVAKAVTAEIQRAEIKRQKSDALQYIRSQNDVTPENEDEIAEIMEREGYTVLLDKNPKKAVDLALRDWREANGLTAPAAEASEKRGLAKQQARGVSGTSASGAGQKKWGEAEIVEIAKDPERWAKDGPAIMAYLKGKETGRS
jgi:hypothetical protein